MNIAAYCRVSTDKADQHNSLEAQKELFSEYTKRTGDTLVRLYADEGISGTKIKNRKEFLRMMSDAAWIASICLKSHGLIVKSSSPLEASQHKIFFILSAAVLINSGVFLFLMYIIVITYF